MTEREAIKTVMKKHKVNQTDFAKSLGYSGQSGIAGRLNGKAMQTDTLCKFLGALNCDLVIRDKDTGDEYVVDLFGTNGNTAVEDKVVSYKVEFDIQVER